MPTTRPSHPASPRRRQRDRRGAAAVEFALVSVLLFPLLLGIIQYGLFFNDSINTRQGIREAARQGVVRSFPACGGASTDMDKLKCNAKVQVGALAGTVYVKAWYPTGGWVKGNPLKVCAAVKNTAPGMLPMPNGGWTRSQATMAVEQDATPLPTGSTTEDSLPSGQNWIWCTQP
jgi:Flp pilus assembly pilin Flp